MARRPDYIPTNMDAFNTWQINLVTTVVANAAAWNLIPAAVTELQNASAAFGPVFTSVNNKENRTRQQMAAYRLYRQQYDGMLRTFVQSYLANNATIPMAERVGMGLNPRGFTPRQPKGQILTAPEVRLRSLGGGKVRFTFKREEDSGRASMDPNSTGVAIYYRFAPVGVAPLPVPNPEPTPPVESLTDPNTTTPEEADIAGLPTMTGYELEVSTRARVLRQVPLDRIGMVMHVFAQWVNSSKPQYNGPYSMVTTVVVG